MIYKDDVIAQATTLEIIRRSRQTAPSTRQQASVAVRELYSRYPTLESLVHPSLQGSLGPRHSLGTPKEKSPGGKQSEAREVCGGKA
jgi:hypothetical protein